MPPIVLGFFILVGSLAGWPFVRDLPKGVDHGVSLRGKPAEDVFRAWSAPRWETWTRGDECTITFFATASWRSEIVTDEAFAVGKSLTVTKDLYPGYKMRKHFLFANPDPPHEVYARRVVNVKCLQMMGGER